MHFRWELDMWHLEVTLRMVFLLFLFCGLSYSCGSGEYEVHGDCCQMCPPGTYVQRHCTEHNGTQCLPCAEKSFIDHPSGLLRCLECKMCDPGLGLKTERECSPTSDAVCGPLDHHYCTKKEKSSCRFAQEHTICRPGQYIIHKGTTSMNTKCGDCPDKTFSNKSSSAHCIPHTDCQSLGLKEITAGTNTSDTECGPTSSTDDQIVLIVSVAVPLVLGVIGLICTIIYCHRRRKQNMQKETDPAETVELKGIKEAAG